MTLITVSGKGGTGKTTFLTLALKSLIQAEGEKTDILVIDGDPDSNMPDVLGINHC
jgi:CO dehydrogenase nickel-insertion accessory protein CooC1